MNEFGDFLKAVTTRLAQGLGVKPSDRQKLAKWKTDLAQAKADNADALEKLKEEIQKIEQRIRQKKAKFDQAHGLTQKMIGREIEQIFRELDRKEQQADIILSGVEGNSLALDKVGELERALERGVSEERLDTLAVQLEETMVELQQADNALKDLLKVSYQAPETPAVDLERRTKELEGQKQPNSTLSEATLARLKQLEQDSED